MNEQRLPVQSVLENSLPTANLPYVVESSANNITERADYSGTASIEDMRVNLCRANILMPQLFLYRTNVHAPLKKVCREGMAQRMATSGFINIGITNSGPNCLLNATFINVVTTNNARVWVSAPFRCWEHILPTPFPGRVWILSRQGIRQKDFPKAGAKKQ